MNNRKYISKDIERELFTKSRRRCCLCYGLNRDFGEKKGQIAHLNHDPSNNSLDNLAYLCLDHHNEYDSLSKQTKSLQMQEVKQYRDELYQAVIKFNNGGEIPQRKTLEGGFLIGKRLQSIRNDLALQSSEFVEMISFNSEKIYLDMEANKIECNEEVIQGIYKSFGILPDYIKHGYLPMIKPQIIDWKSNPTQSIKKIISLSPEFLWLAVNNSTIERDLPIISDIKNLYLKMVNSYLSAGLLVEITPKKYLVFDLNISLNIQEYCYRKDLVQAFFCFLKGLYEETWDFRVIQINNHVDFSKIVEGKIFPEKIIKKYYSHYGFVFDLIDYDRKNLYSSTYDSKYGSWINQLHDNFKTIDS